MVVPLLDLKAQYSNIKNEIKKEVDDVFESQYFILGPKVKEFEDNVASYLDVKNALGVSSGSDAILMPLMAEGIGDGDEVITTTFSFFATAGSIIRTGAKPVFVDIDPVTYNIDPDLIESKITEKTKAIIPVHLFGQTADMDKIMAIAQEYNLIVIEDAAQAIGAKQNGKCAGTFGEYGCYSFFPSKNLGGAGDGGLVVTNDDNLGHLINIMRNHGMEPKYYHKFIGGNFRLDALQAVVLNVKLKYLDSWSDQRAKNAELYNRLFEEAGLTSEITLPVALDNNRHIYNQYSVLVKNREELRKHLIEKNIGHDVYYPVCLHEQECFASLGYKKGDFPVAEGVADSILSLPVYSELTEEQITYVVNSIAEFYA